MTSLLYTSCLEDQARGDIDFAADTFRCLLVTSAYIPDPDHARRSDIIGEAVGTGYTEGGQDVDATVTADALNERVDVTFANPSWPASSLTAAGAVIYKSNGDPADDQLICFIEFDDETTSTGGDFSVSLTSPLRFQKA